LAARGHGADPGHPIPLPPRSRRRLRPVRGNEESDCLPDSARRGRANSTFSSPKTASRPLPMSSSASSEARGRSRSAATVILWCSCRRYSAGADCASARRAAPDDPGLAAHWFRASAGHDRVGERFDRSDDGAVARIDGVAAAAVSRRRALLAWRHLLTRQPPRQLLQGRARAAFQNAHAPQRASHRMPHASLESAYSSL
jgi:hypothetical protein